MKRVAQKVFSLVIFGTIGLFLFLCFTLYRSTQVSPSGDNISLKHLPIFRTSLAEHTRLEILEGLPHQDQEPESLYTERQRNDVIERHGFHFYSRILMPSQTDEETISNSLRADNTISRWSGTKSCGSFHPDYLIRWFDQKEKRYEALICFGCREIRLYSEAANLYADLGGNYYSTLKSTVSGYGKNRPPSP